MKKILLTATGITLLFAACNTGRETNSEEKTTGKDTTVKKTADSILQQAADILSDTAKPVFEQNGIKVYYFTNSPDFPDAGLTMEQPDIKKPLKPGAVTFKYNVKNYQLSMQTNGANMCNCANSDKGQHIHQILNDSPYTAHYTDTFTKALKPGHYVNLSFLSRSYHESLKNKTAYVLNQFNVGAAKGKNIDLKAPLMFYSRPKGEYKGKDTKSVLLDFYLVNVDLSKDGYKVKATINGKSEFTLTEWRAYMLSGLPMGENTIRLELLDKNGKPVSNPFNPVERKFTLAQ